MKKEVDIEKIIKRVQTEADKKNERRFGVMMEEINDGFKLVKDAFKGVYERFDKIDETLESHKESVANLSMDMTEVKSDLGQVKFDIKFMVENKVDKKHFVALDERVRRLEKTK